MANTIIPTPPVTPTWPNMGGGFFGLNRDALNILDDLAKLVEIDQAAAKAEANKKLPPMNCIKCQFRNEYVGREHLDEKGRYICRQCRGSR